MPGIYNCVQKLEYCNRVFDKTTGKMLETSNGGGHFTDVTLNPIVTVI